MLQFFVLTAIFTHTEHTSLMLLVCKVLLANWRWLLLYVVPQKLWEFRVAQKWQTCPGRYYCTANVLRSSRFCLDSHVLSRPWLHFSSNFEVVGQLSNIILQSEEKRSAYDKVSIYFTLLNLQLLPHCYDFLPNYRI